MAKHLIRACKSIPVYVDSQVSQSESNHQWYRGANFIFLNEFEADCVAKKFKVNRSKSQLEQISKFLVSDIVYKRGERGAVVESKLGSISDPGFKVNAVDTCGAGDAFLASFVSNNGDLEKANRWAALSTTYKGTIVPKLDDLGDVTR
jgi:sugar/nucleoside kinase (ribokinase family)